MGMYIVPPFIAQKNISLYHKKFELGISLLLQLKTVAHVLLLATDVRPPTLDVV